MNVDKGKKRGKNNLSIKVYLEINSKKSFFFKSLNGTKPLKAHKKMFAFQVRT